MSERERERERERDRDREREREREKERVRGFVSKRVRRDSRNVYVFLLQSFFYLSNIS